MALNRRLKTALNAAEFTGDNICSVRRRFNATGTGSSKNLDWLSRKSKGLSVVKRALVSL